jgi:hypothetical protein
MTPKRRRQLQFCVAIAVSAAAHLSALRLPLPRPHPAAEIVPVAMTVTIDVEADEPPPVRVEPEDEVQLGLDAPLPPLPSWLGFTTPEFHAAAKAETDQAAFDDQPRGEPEPFSGDAAALAHDIPPLVQAEPEQAVPNTDQPSAEQPPAEQPPAPSPAPAPEAGPEPMEPAPSLPPQQEFSVLLKILSLPAADFDAVLAAIADAGSPKSDPTASERGAKDDPSAARPVEIRDDSAPPRADSRDHSPQPTPPTPTTPTANPGSPAPHGVPVAAEISDRQSDPTSIIEVSPDHWRLGKPLAGAGLELRPRKPVFTHLVLLTASPGNPTAEIRFRADGVPAAARLLASSGDGRVDEAVLSSLYRWRAAGEELRKLGERETLDVRIKLVLNSRGG